jgi:5'-AMP-activated protein kinase regulatory gamma subunit
VSCRGIQPDHFGVLALPVAEFLAVKHGTSYLGYSQHSSSSARHPFFASGPPSTGRRPADADAADADAAAAATAMETDGAGEGRVPASPSKSPKRSGGGQGRHKTVRRPSSEVGLRLITCSPESTLGEVSTNRQHDKTWGGARTASIPAEGCLVLAVATEVRMLTAQLLLLEVSVTGCV